MSRLYYTLFLKIVNDNTRVCFIGDPHQCIYQFNNADSRYLTMIDKIYPGDWKVFSLNKSYRLTIEVSAFVNYCFGTHITSDKSGPKPRYIMCNAFNVPFQEILYYFLLGYTANDIFILAPSVKMTSQSAVKMLANKLSSLGIKIYIPSFEEEKLDKDVIDEKIVISSFHQVKGLERKVAVIIGFDSSYCNYYGGGTHSFNDMYVAMTRAENLSLIHHYKNDCLPFVTPNAIREYTDVIEIQQVMPAQFINRTELKSITVTKIVNSLSIELLLSIDVKTRTINAPENKIKIPSKSIQEDGTYEIVSDINGEAIPLYYEYIRCDGVFENLSLYRKMEIHKLDLCYIENLLLTANKWSSYKSGLNYKMNQIKDYNWLSDRNLKLCYDRLDKRLKNPIFEQPVSTRHGSIYINGYLDCVDGDDVWELKCVNQLDRKHILQLAIYKYLHKKGRYFLLNILDNHLLEIISDLDEEIMNTMIKNATDKKYLTDSEFITTNQKSCRR